MVHIKKSSLDILFSLDINTNYVLKVILYVEEFDLDGPFQSNKEIPSNVNLITEIQALLKDVHLTYMKRKIDENKFNEEEKIDASNFVTKKFETTPQNMLSLRVEGNNFLLKRKIIVKNFHSYTHDEKPHSHEILKALKHLDSKKLIMKQANFKDSKLKELKPTKIDLSKIPTSIFADDDEVDEEYKPFIKHTSLTNPVSTLSKDIFLKHKRRRTNVSKPSKAPSNIQNLYNEYQNIFSNLRLNTINKYINMQKFKETISNN